MAQICFDQSTFYTVLIMGIGTIIYVIISIYQEKEREFIASMHIPESTLRDARETISHAMQRLQGMQTRSPDINDDNNRMRNHYEDLQRIVNPLQPPVRRNTFIAQDGETGRLPIGIPTRGEYGTFHQMGFLHNPDDPKQALPLMGRRIHSNQYEYYTVHHYNPSVKIPIKLTGNKEINDGESVSIDGYPIALQVKIYEYDAPRYIPY